MRSFKDLQNELVERHQEVSADFKVSASGRKVPVQRKTIKDVGDVDNDGDVDANDKKRKQQDEAVSFEDLDVLALAESSKEDQRLIQLARLGLVDSSDVAKLRTAMNQLHADKALSIQQRTLLLTVFEDLIGLVTGDDQLFRRVKMDVQKEATEPKDKDDVPFDGPYTKKPSATPGKHGSGYSTARHLARLALQKQQKKPTK